MCESLLGLRPISAEIEKKKLTVLQKLIELNDRHQTLKQIFLSRLFSTLVDSSHVHLGFFFRHTLYIIMIYMTIYRISNYYNWLLPWKT